MGKPLHIGSANGRRLELTDIERSMHIQVVGGTGSGKSRLMEHCIRQDIAAGRGLCLIDPHGELAGVVEQWAALRGLGRTRKIHVVRPGSDEWTAGFNPLRIGVHESATVRVDAMVSACAQVWGGQDLHQTPRLKKVLTALFFALAARDLTLADALFLLRSGDPDGTRCALTTALPDPVLDFIWGELNGLSTRDFADYAESTVSRLTEFLSAPSVRLMLGQRTHVLNFRQIMDEGHIVLVNLSLATGLSRQNARVVGSLLVTLQSLEWNTVVEAIKSMPG